MKLGGSKDQHGQNLVFGAQKNQHKSNSMGCRAAHRTLAAAVVPVLLQSKIVGFRIAVLLCCWACGIASTVVKNGESAQAIYTAIAPRTFLNTLQVPGMVCIVHNLYKHGHQSLLQESGGL